MQPYSYNRMHFYITNTNIRRSNFTTMPAFLIPIWDSYWIAMDMTESSTAKQAVAVTRALFEQNPKRAPASEKIMEAMSTYSKLSKLEAHVKATKKVVGTNREKEKIKFTRKGSLYDGSWFTT